METVDWPRTQLQLEPLNSDSLLSVVTIGGLLARANSSGRMRSFPCLRFTYPLT
jgi:hypothetical protein